MHECPFCVLGQYNRPQRKSDTRANLSFKDE